MLVVDNFLPPQQFLAIKNAFLNESFPWTLTSKTNTGKNLLCEERFDYQLVHMLYHAPNIISKYLDTINPLIKKINASILLRAKANVTFCNQNLHEFEFHTDLPEHIAKIAKTAVFYLNTNNGYTLFKETKEKVISLENRIVFFDAIKEHTGSNCTDQKFRTVLNLNFIP